VGDREGRASRDINHAFLRNRVENENQNQEGVSSQRVCVGHVGSTKQKREKSQFMEKLVTWGRYALAARSRRWTSSNVFEPSKPPRTKRRLSVSMAAW